MQYWLLLITLISTMAWGQVTTYNLNNDTATHGFSLPISCPLATGGNCHNAGTQNNQATVGPILSGLSATSRNHRAFLTLSAQGGS